MSFRGNSPEARDIAHIIHPYTNLTKHKEIGPLIIEEAKGVWATDSNGKKYLEGLAGLWCTGLGYGEERLVQAAANQMRKLSFSHIFAHRSHMPAIELAEKLCEMAPGANTPKAMDKVFFANSGSEGNDTVVKLIWYYHNAIGKRDKKKIIARVKGYHGVTVASASLTGLPPLHKDFDLPIEGILHTTCPHYYRFGKTGESEAEFVQRLADDLEALILKEGPDTIGGFIAEPLMGAGGVIIPPDGYFAAIQPILKKYDILFAADEVICGFGRTGNMFGSETFGMEPDIITVAKQLSSAYLPISAVLVNKMIGDAVCEHAGKLGTFGMGYTYSGHPVPVAVALEVLKIYEERDILGHVREIMPIFQASLRKFANLPHVGEVRGIGLIGAIEMVANKETHQNFDPALGVGAKLAKFCEFHGLIVRPLGNDAIALCPPLIINEDEIKFMSDAIGKALDDTHAWLKEIR